MDRVAIMLRVRKDIHDRIAEAAKEVDKPITRWVMDAIMDRLPVKKDAPVKVVMEKPAKPVKLTAQEEKALYKANKKAECLNVLNKQHKWFTYEEVKQITGIPDSFLLDALVNEGKARTKYLSGSEDDEKWVSVYMSTIYPEPIEDTEEKPIASDDEVPFI